MWQLELKVLQAYGDSGTQPRQWRRRQTHDTTAEVMEDDDQMLLERIDVEEYERQRWDGCNREEKDVSKKGWLWLLWKPTLKIKIEKYAKEDDGQEGGSGDDFKMTTAMASKMSTTKSDGSDDDESQRKVASTMATTKKT